MIKDIEEESKTKFSMGVEFSFTFKDFDKILEKVLTNVSVSCIIHHVADEQRRHTTEYAIVA